MLPLSSAGGADRDRHDAGGGRVRRPLTTAAGLVYGEGYGDDPARRAALVALLRDVFSVDLTDFDRRDYWEPGYRAFTFFETATGRAVANASVLPLALVAGGEAIEAAAIQSVATLPAFRRRGLFRSLLGRVLEYCDPRFRALLLHTPAPALYEPFGFRVVPLHRFEGPPPPPVVAGGDVRKLGPSHEPLILRLLEGRTPVSLRFGFRGHASMFLLFEMRDRFARLRYFPDLDCIAVVQVERRTLLLDDVVGPEIPPLAEIIARVAPRARSIDVSFTPDRLGWSGTPVERIEENKLMVRGPITLTPPIGLAGPAAF